MNSGTQDAIDLQRKGLAWLYPRIVVLKAAIQQDIAKIADSMYEKASKHE